MKKRVNDLREIPLYPMAEAARIMRAPYSTMRNWFPPQQGKSLTFIQLVEAYIIQTLRSRHKMKMAAINSGRAWLREKTGHPYPLALENLGLETDGAELFFDSEGRLASATCRGQLAMRGILDTFLKRVDYDGKGIAMRFYPFTKGYSKESPRLIVVDPHLNFGRPCLASRAISTVMIARRRSAGESRAALADDYRCETSEIDEALNHEARAARAA